MLNCKKVTQLVSEATERKLGLFTWMRLWMHFAMCGVCLRFWKSISHIHSATLSRAKDVEQGLADKDVVLSEPARNRIRKHLEAIDR